MTQEEVIKLVENSDLDDATKSAWVKRITEEGLTPDTLNQLKDAFQAEIDAGFEKLGVDISNTPEYKEKEQEMIKDVQAVKDEFDQKMNKTSAMMSDLQTQAGETIDKLKTEEIKATIE